MARTPKTHITIEVNDQDFNRLVHKLEPATTLEPLAVMFEELGEEYLNEAKIFAPVDQGHLRSTLARGANDNIFDLDTAQPPRFVKVGTSHIDTDSAFPYPKRLDERARYRYRGGGAQGSRARGSAGRSGGALRGSPTKGWFSQVRERNPDLFSKIIRKAEQKIKAKWNGR